VSYFFWSLFCDLDCYIVFHWLLRVLRRYLTAKKDLFGKWPIGAAIILLRLHKGDFFCRREFVWYSTSLLKLAVTSYSTPVLDSGNQDAIFEPN